MALLSGRAAVPATFPGSALADLTCAPCLLTGWFPCRGTAGPAARDRAPRPTALYGGS